MSTKIILFVLSFSAMLYLLIILIFTSGWHRLKSFSLSHRHQYTPLSVVVPFRNEAFALKTLLEALLQQTYPAELLEIILVNDHSEDDGKTIAEKIITENKAQNIRLIDSAGKGKKAALREGINAAAGTLIVTTDADCLPHKSWLAGVVALYEEKRPRLILGPVVYENETSLLQKLFSLDFISLVASGAGSAGAGLPFMGNAANLTFEKQIYLEAEANTMKTHFASGDDVFLIHYVKRRFGRKAIAFIKNKRSEEHTSELQSH